MDGTIRLFEATTGKEIRVFRGHEDGVTDLLIYSTQNMFTSSWDGTVRMWDIQTAECLKVLKGHTRGVLSLRFYRDILYSASSDGTVRSWVLQPPSNGLDSSEKSNSEPGSPIITFKEKTSFRHSQTSSKSNRVPSRNMASSLVTSLLLNRSDSTVAAAVSADAFLEMSSRPTADDPFYDRRASRLQNPSQIRKAMSEQRDRIAKTSPVSKRADSNESTGKHDVQVKSNTSSTEALAEISEETKKSPGDQTHQPNSSIVSPNSSHSTSSVTSPLKPNVLMRVEQHHFRGQDSFPGAESFERPLLREAAKLLASNETKESSNVNERNPPPLVIPTENADSLSPEDASPQNVRTLSNAAKLLAKAVATPPPPPPLRIPSPTIDLGTQRRSSSSANKVMAKIAEAFRKRPGATSPNRNSFYSTGIESNSEMGARSLSNSSSNSKDRRRNSSYEDYKKARAPTL